MERRPRTAGALVLVPVLALGWAAATAPPAWAQARSLASEKLDVDGDGRDDTVSVESDGRVLLVRGGQQGAKAVAEAKLGTATPAGPVRFQALGLEGRRLLVVRAGTEALLLEWTGEQLAMLWQHPHLGPQGKDAEWSLGLEAGPGGVILFEERPDVSRCDGRRAWLHPKKLDLAAKPPRFRPVSLAPSPPPTAIVLTARRGAAPEGLDAQTPVRSFRFKGASTQSFDQGSAADLTAPRELDDGKLDTRWEEALGGYGRGEFVTALPGVTGAKVRALRIVPGDASSAKAFRQANRLERLVVSTGRDEGFVVTFPTDPASDAGAPGDPYWVILPEPRPASCLTVFVDRVYPGSSASGAANGGRTAISELAVLTDLDGNGTALLGALVEKVAKGGDGAADAEHLLGQRGTVGIDLLVAAAGEANRAADARRRLRLALARLGKAEGATQVTAGLREAAPEDFPRFRDGLRAMGNGATAALTSLLADENAPEAVRIVAAELLGHIPSPEARAALEERLGQGSRELRHAVRAALGGRAPTELLIALTSVQDAVRAGSPPAREADLWRVVGLLAAHAPASEARKQAGEAVALRLLDDVVKDYERRYRLAQAAAALSDESIAWGLFVQAEKDEPALRQAAVEALADAGAPAVKKNAETLALLLADADPEVRRATVETLGQANQAWHFTDQVLARLAEENRWPMVRRAAAEALSPLCTDELRKGPPVSKALYAAAERDRDEQVRRMSLFALVHCREPRIGQHLLATAKNAAVAPSLREYAASLLGLLGDKSLVPPAVELFQTARSQAFANEDAARVAASLARALGQLQDPRATNVLLEALSDSTFPAVQAAAAEAVGRLCPPRGPQELRRAAAGTDPLVVRAARLALTTCKPN